MHESFDGGRLLGVHTIMKHELVLPLGIAGIIVGLRVGWRKHDDDHLV